MTLGLAVGSLPPRPPPSFRAFIPRRLATVCCARTRPPTQVSVRRAWYPRLPSASRRRLTGIMSVSPLAPAPVVSGVKRSSPDIDGNNIDNAADANSPLKRVRVDDPCEISEGIPEQPRSTPFEDSKALIPLLDAAVKGALAFLQSQSAVQIISLEKPRSQSFRWECHCSVLLTTSSYLSADTFAEWVIDETRHTLRQSWLLCLLQAFLTHDYDSVVNLKPGLDYLLDGDRDGDGRADWCAAFLRLINACLEDEDSISSGRKLSDVIVMLQTYGLIPAANVNGNRNESESAPDASSPVSDGPTQEQSLQSGIALAGGGGIPINASVDSADNDAFVEDEFDFMAIARRAAQSALNPLPDEPSVETAVATPSKPTTLALPSSPMSQDTPKDLPTRTPTTAARSISNGAKERNTSNSSATLIAQYEEARAFAAQRSQQKRLVASNPNSSRRPWTEEEENTLMKGLDQLHGPYWAQILERYGEYGTHSTVLRGRTQVQLKDKARNLKLYFLKNDLPVPDSLQHVTGGLKHKAGGGLDAGKTSSEERTN